MFLYSPLVLMASEHADDTSETAARVTVFLEVKERQREPQKNQAFAAATGIGLFGVVGFETRSHVTWRNIQQAVLLAMVLDF